MANNHIAAIPVLQRILAKVVIHPNSCWMFQGCQDPSGYGRISRSKKEGPVAVHRYMYELVFGQVPSGLELDHICHKKGECTVPARLCPHRRCVNPWHLEPVTHTENTRRGNAGSLPKQFCIRGHSLAQGVAAVDSNGRRQCRLCNALRARNYRRRHLHEQSQSISFGIK